MVCNIIDECRCYAYSDTTNPMSNQFCAARRGAQLKPCPADCCAGGCPGQVEGIEPKQPFRIVDHFNQTDNTKPLIYLGLIIVTIALLFILLKD